MEVKVLDIYLEDALKRLEKLRKIALKMGRSISWDTAQAEPYSIEKKVYNPFAITADDHYKTVVYPRTLITVKIDDGKSLLQFDDARFVAKIEVTEEGNIFHTAPDYTETLPDELYSNFEHKCDHCHHNRKRIRYYLVEKDGELLQVGSTCVKEFFGINPQHLLRVFEFLRYASSHNYDDSYFSGGKFEYCHVVETVARMSAGVVLIDGFYSKPETRNTVFDFIHEPHHYCGESRDYYIEKVKQYQDAGINEIINQFDMKAFRDYVDAMPVNNYSNNLKVILQNRAISSHQSFAILVSGVYVYLRDTNQLPQSKTEVKRTLLNEWVPANQKARITFENVLVQKKHVCNGYYGESYLYRMQDVDGRVLVWFATNPNETLDDAIENGKPVIVTASIKKFDEREYNGTMNKQTVLTRAKVLEDNWS